MYPQNSEGWSKFPGRLKLRPSIAQTAFVRVVTPRKLYTVKEINSIRFFNLRTRESNTKFYDFAGTNRKAVDVYWRKRLYIRQLTQLICNYNNTPANRIHQEPAYED